MLILMNTLLKLKYSNFLKQMSSCVQSKKKSTQFEPVFSFPTIKYISLINRLKVYQITGTCIAIPSSGLLEMACLVPDYTFITTSYIGITAAVVLSLASLPFRNVIGFLYISDDDKYIKISSVDFWGKRTDKIIKTDEWTPLLEIPQRTIDAIYLSPQLTDGTKYKLFVRFGKVLCVNKFGYILE